MFSICTPTDFLHAIGQKGFHAHPAFDKNESIMHGLDGLWFLPLTEHLAFNNNNKEFFNQKMEEKITFTEVTNSHPTSSSSFINKLSSNIHLY